MRVSDSTVKSTRLAAPFVRRAGQKVIDQDLAILAEQPGGVAQVDQLLGLERHRHRLGHLLHREVEDLARGRDAERGDQHHVLLVEVGVDLLGDDLAHRAGVLVIDAINHAHRPRGDEVAPGDADVAARHRRVGQALREQRLDLEAGHRHRRLDALQRLGIGHPQAMVEARLQPATRLLGVDLRARAMHQHQADAERGEQVAVVGEALRALAGGDLAAEADDEGTAAEGVDVGRGAAHPGHELGRGVIHAWNRRGGRGGFGTGTAVFGAHAFTAVGAGHARGDPADWNR